MDQSSLAMLGHAQNLNQNIASLTNVLRTALPLSCYTGSFTMAAAATKTVTDAHCKAASVIVLVPTNAAVGTLQGSAKCLYPTPSAGSFLVSTASAAAAAGTELFLYLIINTGS